MQMAEDIQSSKRLRITRNEQDPKKGSWVEVPRFFIDEYFGILPSSFIKFFLKVWRHVTIPPHYSWKLSRDQMGVPPAKAALWIKALESSGVIQVEMGRWTAKHDQPTVFSYDDDAVSFDDFRAFFEGLDAALKHFAEAKKKTAKTKTKHHVDYGGEKYEEFHKPKVALNSWAFRLFVMREVDERRKARNLKPLFADFLAQCVAKNSAKIVEGKVEPILHLLERRQRPDEDDYEYAIRTEEEDRERARW
jgi:hypothetical protein